MRLMLTISAHSKTSTLKIEVAEYECRFHVCRHLSISSFDSFFFTCKCIKMIIVDVDMRAVQIEGVMAS